MAKDPPFHFEIWRGPQPEFGIEPKAIYYVENHNAQCGYGELAEDFEMAARAILATYRESQLGNWMAPLAHLVRQTLEISLKSLISSIRERDVEVPEKALRGHDLGVLWEQSIAWLGSNGFDANSDARRDVTAHLIHAYDAIDPSGDLFRFGISYKEALGQQKSYDRVGIELDQFEYEFNAAMGFLNHWDAAVFRKTIAESEGWKEDPFFNVDDFPRLPKER